MISFVFQTFSYTKCSQHWHTSGWLEQNDLILQTLWKFHTDFFFVDILIIFISSKHTLSNMKLKLVTLKNFNLQSLCNVFLFWMICMCILIWRLISLKEEGQVAHNFSMAYVQHHHAFRLVYLLLLCQYELHYSQKWP